MTANQGSLSKALMSTDFIAAPLHTVCMAGLSSPASPGGLANTFTLRFLQKSGLALCGSTSPSKQRHSYLQEIPEC